MERYQRIEQKPEQCGSACLEMILKRHGIKHLSQDEIFKNTGKVLDEKKINSFFSKYNILLKAEYYPISRIVHKNVSCGTSEIKSFLNDEFKKNDIIANFWVKELNQGHYALINAVYEMCVAFCDPDPRRKNVIAQFDVLPIIMGSHHDKKERGFYVIKPALF